MALEGNQVQEGIFVNPNAIDAREKKWLSKLVGQILKQAEESSFVGDIFVPNALDAKMGTEGKFYDWGQLVARLKPDGIPSDIQKILPSKEDYSLDEWEVKVGMTDRAKINSQMQAQDLLTAGDAARAFTRAFEAQGLNAVHDNFNSTAGTNWTTATDADILDQLSALFDEVWDAGFTPSALVLTQKQLSRITRIGLGYAVPLTASELIQKEWNISQIHISRKIRYKLPDGTYETLFDPTGKLFVLDKDATGVFTQRPTTVEKYRDVMAGVDFAILRKYFKTVIVQKDAGHMLTGLVI